METLKLTSEEAPEAVRQDQNDEIEAKLQGEAVMTEEGELPPGAGPVDDGPAVDEDGNPKINPDYGKTRDQLIIEHENFAYEVVKKEFGKYRNPVREDLLSAARYGIVYAAGKYNSFQHNAKFISYAVNWIRYYIHKEIQNLNPIKFNQNFLTKRNKLAKAVAKYKAEHEDADPTVAELAKETGISEKVIQNVYSVNHGENYKYVSFQSLIKPGSTKNLGETNEIQDKLMSECLSLEDDTSDRGMTHLIFMDSLRCFREEVGEQDAGIFTDKYIEKMSNSDIAKKYGIKFPSLVNYKLKKLEKIWRKIVE